MGKPFDVSKFRKEITKSIDGLSIGFNDPTDWISTGNFAFYSTDLGISGVYAFIVVHFVIIHSLALLVNLPINTQLCQDLAFTVPTEPTTTSF
jgi:hypothetical protein